MIKQPSIEQCANWALEANKKVQSQNDEDQAFFLEVCRMAYQTGASEMQEKCAKYCDKNEEDSGWEIAPILRSIK